MMRRFGTFLAVAGAFAVLGGPVTPAGAATGIGNPVAGNLGFGTIVEHDAVLGSTETEGTVAVGGDLAFGPGYNVSLHTVGNYTAPGDARPTALLVGGRVNTAASDANGVLKVLSQGYIKIGDLAGVRVLDTDTNGASVNTRVVPAGADYNATPRIELTTSQPVPSVGPATMPINFPSLFGTYRQRANAIANCSNTVVLNDAAGNPLDHPATGYPPGTRGYLTLTPGQTNVLKLSASELNNITELTFRTPPDASTPFVVVVGGEVGDWHTPNLAGVSGPQAPYMLWDFPDATTITITAGDTLEGTLYAPSAAVTDLDASNIEGDIVAKSFVAGPQTAPGDWVNAGEIHNFPFAADLDCTPITPPTTSPTTPSTSETTSSSPSSPGPSTPSHPTTTPHVGPSTGPTPSAPQLPKTGGDLGSLSWLAAVGALLAVAGAGMLRLRRRAPQGRHMA